MVFPLVMAEYWNKTYCDSDLCESLLSGTRAEVQDARGCRPQPSRVVFLLFLWFSFNLVESAAELKKTKKTPSFWFRLRLYWCFYRLSFVCMHPDKSYSHIINPFGFNQNKGKTTLRWKPFAQPSYLHVWQSRKRGRRSSIVISVFHFCCWSRKAVFCSCSSEGKWTWIR